MANNVLFFRRYDWGEYPNLIANFPRERSSSYPCNSGSVSGTTIGTLLGLLLGFGPSVAMLAALTAAIMLPLLRVFHPPGIALAMCLALLHSGA
jgi:hypothetical protein